jgi:DNA processing protein
MSELFAAARINFEENLILAYLSNQINLTPNKLVIIKKFYSDLNSAIVDNFEKLADLKLKWLQKFDISKTEKDLKELKNNLTLNKINLLSHVDSDYPPSLKNLENYPLILYYQGNIAKLKEAPCLTVVGSRNTDIYAQLLLDKILAPACRLGVGVVSGLALGIDGMSHQIALDNDAYTVGVIGSGLDQKSFYPSQNWVIRNRILETGGCVISEYPPNKLPNIYTFPQRNRILAALTELTWVVQASLKSGSLITALKARDLGKNLATTPADIRNLSYDGNIKLIKEGCEIITETEDIISLLGLKVHNEIQPPTKLIFNSKEEKEVYEKLSIQPQSIEKLSQVIGSSDLTLQLTMLELAGVAMNVGENNWIRV